MEVMGLSQADMEAADRDADRILRGMAPARSPDQRLGQPISAAIRRTLSVFGQRANLRLSAVPGVPRSGAGDALRAEVAAEGLSAVPERSRRPRRPTYTDSWS